IISSPLAKGDQGGFSGEANPPQSPFAKGGGDAVPPIDEPLSLWVAAERLPRLLQLLADAVLKPPLAAPEPYASEFAAAKDDAREKTLLEIVRGRLEMLGPVTAKMLAQPLGVDVGEVDLALLTLEQEGYVLRGQFTPGARPKEEMESEWCERGLLARIHRYTVNRLRAEIEPVTTQDFMRFLFRWQSVAKDTRKEGPDALAAILANLEGFEAPAIAWESDILPLRLQNYDFTWLDDLCLSGRAGWARLAKPKQTESSKRAGPVRSTPIALVTRRNMAIWSAAANPQTAVVVEATMNPRAERALEYLQQHGASFFDEIVDGARLLPSELEEALGELVALGRITSDSFAGIRALLLPLEKRKPLGNTKRRHRTAMFGIQDAGRWSLIRASSEPDDNTLEHIALTLLRRYGVIFWRLLAREADWLPPLRDILRVLRRMEA